MLGRCAGRPRVLRIATRCLHDATFRQTEHRAARPAAFRFAGAAGCHRRAASAAQQRRARAADVGADDRDDLAGRRQHRGHDQRRRRSSRLRKTSCCGDSSISRARRASAEREVEGAGSGVIVDAANGYILTNHHVVANADTITVTLLENRSLTARVVGSDEGSDLAVLQVDAANLTQHPVRRFDEACASATTSSRSAIRSGSRTRVTSGIVSALGRSGLNNQAFEDFIQTDASINPGNSGGALVNLNGELVGINSAIISRTGGNVGIGFAIPVNMVRAVMEQLIATGMVRRGLLGVNIQDVTPEIAATFGLPGNSGALVSQVAEDSAAERAGIQIEDVIVSINGTRLRDSGSLQERDRPVAARRERGGGPHSRRPRADRARRARRAARRPRPSRPRRPQEAGDRARCRVRRRRARRQLEPERRGRLGRRARRSRQPGRRSRLASRRRHHEGEPRAGQHAGRSDPADARTPAPSSSRSNAAIVISSILMR